VEERFGFTRQYAHRLITVKQWAKEMVTTVDIPKTANATWRARREAQLARERSFSAKQGAKTKAMSNGKIADNPLTPQLSIPNLDAEFANFKATVSRWEKALPRPEYNQLVDRAIICLEDVAEEMESADLPDPKNVLQF
jgi:hypothetical protein